MKVTLKLKEFIAIEAKASGKIPVFGMLKQTKSYTQVVKNCGVKELLSILNGFEFIE